MSNGHLDHNCCDNNLGIGGFGGFGGSSSIIIIIVIAILFCGNRRNDCDCRRRC